MTDATLQVQVLPEVDRNALLAQVKEIKTVIQGGDFTIEPKVAGEGIIEGIREELKAVSKQIEEATSQKEISSLVKKQEELKGELGKKLEGDKKGGMMGGLMEGLSGMFTKVIGPLAIIGAVAQLLKPALKVVGLILKVLMEFLRPISDVITILLMPILGILRPILKVFQMMIMPFRALSMKLMGEAMKFFMAGETGKGLALSITAFQTMFIGINTVILDLISGVLKAVAAMMGSFVIIVSKPIFFLASLIASMFGEGAVAKVKDAQKYFEDTVVTGGVDFIKGQIDNVLGAFILTQLAVVKSALISVFGESGAPMISLKGFGEVLDKVFEESTITFKDVGADLDGSMLELAKSASGLKLQVALQLDIIQTIWGEVLSQMGEDIKKYLGDVVEGAEQVSPGTAGKTAKHGAMGALAGGAVGPPILGGILGGAVGVALSLGEKIAASFATATASTEEDAEKIKNSINFIDEMFLKVFGMGGQPGGNIPATMKLSMKTVDEDFLKVMDVKKGSIPTTIRESFSNISFSADRFKSHVGATLTEIDNMMSKATENIRRRSRRATSY